MCCLTAKKFIMKLNQCFLLGLKIFYLSFVNFENGVWTISVFWIVMNTIKIFLSSTLFFYSLFLIAETYKDAEQDFQIFFYGAMEIFYLAVNWIYFIIRGKLLEKSLNLAQSVALGLKFNSQNQKLIMGSKTKCIQAFLMFQSYNIVDLLFTFTTIAFNLNFFMIFCHRFIINCFSAFFFFATEFLLVCIKCLKANLERTLKAQSSTIMSSMTTKYEKTKACDELSTEIDNICSYHQLVFELCNIIEELFNMVTLFSLVYQLLLVSMQVWKVFLKVSRKTI